jgi:hypothetical protein
MGTSQIMQVVAHEDRMRFNLDDDVKIPRNASFGCAFPFISQLEPGTGVHASGNLDAKGV